MNFVVCVKINQFLLKITKKKFKKIVEMCVQYELPTASQNIHKIGVDAVLLQRFESLKVFKINQSLCIMQFSIINYLIAQPICVPSGFHIVQCSVAHHGQNKIAARLILIFFSLSICINSIFIGQ